MFDGIINALKGYFPNKLIFWVFVAAVAHALWQLVGGGLDIIMLVKFVAAIVVGTLLATMLAGAAGD